MAVTRSGKLSYTDEQYRIARYESSALDYAIANGYQIVNKGHYKSLAEHDSFVFAPNGMWFWNSRGLKGGAIEFLTQYEHKSLVEAVLTLSGDRTFESAVSSSIPQHYSPMPKRKEELPEKKQFILPPKAKDFKRLYGYLLHERKLDNQIISTLISQKKLYISDKHYNAIFVSYDQNGIAKAAYQRGTLTFAEKPFKMDVPGSDKSFPFHISGNKNSVSVFEGAIDAISHASLMKRIGIEENPHRIAVGGINNYNALERFLEWHPEITHIDLCFDNDYDAVDQVGKPCNHGQVAATKWAEKYSEKGYTISISPPHHKDYNEDLKNYLAAESQKAQQTKEDISELDNSEEEEFER